MPKIFRAGAVASDVVTDFIFLWGVILASGNVTHLRKAFSTSGYQVTVGKTLFLVKFRLLPLGTLDQVNTVKIGYADNDVGLDTTTARVNPVMAFGLDDAAPNGLTVRGTISTSFPGGQPIRHLSFSDDQFGFMWPIAASGKFPFVRTAPFTGGTNPTRQAINAWAVEL